MTNIEFNNKYFKLTQEGNRLPIPDESRKAFLQEVKTLCRKYDITLLHEDIGGGFLLVNGYEDDMMIWFMGACDVNNLSWRKRKQEAENS